MVTRSSMSYQQPPYQSTVNEPIYCWQQKGIYEGSNPRKCCTFFGFFGFPLLIVFVVIYSTDDGLRSSVGSVVLMITGIFGVLFSIIACCCLFGLSETDKNVPESPENTQPVSEPFTQHMMNQGSPSPMYVPVQSVSENPYYDNTPSASNSGNMSNVQQHFQYGVHTATVTPQNFGPEYDQQPAFAPPPPYSSLEGTNTTSAPQFSWSDMASNAQSVPPPLFAPPPYKES